MLPSNYKCDGQMSIFDFLEEPKEEPPKEDKAICSQKEDCEAYGFGCGGTIDPCRFDGPYKWSKHICKFSGHSCNKEELWKVANTLDNITCSETCCRQCQVKSCGARCNGSKEPQDMTYDRKGKGYPAPEWMDYKRCENCSRWAKYQVSEQPPDGWGTIGWCAEHQHKSQAIGYCMNWEDKN